MRSCHNCKQKNICKLYSQIDQVTTTGLKEQVLSINKEPTSTSISSWMDIYRAVARACNFFTYNEGDQSLTPDSKKYALDLSKGLKKDKFFTQEFLSATSPESRIHLISRRLDDNEDVIMAFLTRSQKSEESASEVYESFTHEVMSHFGF